MVMMDLCSIFCMCGWYKGHSLFPSSFNSLPYASLLPATHLVTSVHTQGCCRRTMKFLHAIAQGIWIVNHSCQCMSLYVSVCEYVCICVTVWCGYCFYSGIEQSFKDGHWADESSYEVKGASTLSNVYKTEAPRKARENRALLVRGASFHKHRQVICGPYCHRLFLVSSTIG